MCEEWHRECVTSVCACYSLVLCIRVSDVMWLEGEIWYNGGRGTQLVDTRERKRHICLSECRQPPSSILCVQLRPLLTAALRDGGGWGLWGIATPVKCLRLCRTALMVLQGLHHGYTDKHPHICTYTHIVLLSHKLQQKRLSCLAKQIFIVI